ncbi:hypothetical protein DRQ09_06295 [candidate division KSB1 bacterium]|nr:MAG: hypothetical protein DRQ09_06295 [candidate division KSB1 bacterium]
MNLKLDTKNKGITGEETLTWINDSDVDIVELYFHLYYNAFKNNKSTFMQELQKMGRFRRLPRNEEEYGYCDVQSISILPDGYFEETDLTPTIEFVQPDDNNPYDQTVMKVTLPKPLPPGDTIKVYIKFYSKVPRTIARSGYYRDYYFIAQWFPKIGVFWEGKWNCHQYHATSEFFSDFGTYDVNITVPKDFKIGATGIKRKETPNVDGTITYNFYQENVHGFVWTASPDYIQMVEKFSEPPLREVDITLLIMPEHKKQAERYFKATKAALKYYGSWYGEYPYSHITVVDPAFRSGAGGMEYPTLFTGGTSWLTAKKVQRPEGVTVHECGHQFWYHLVANNEFEDAWLDEGFNTYSTAKCLDAAYGDNFYMRRYFQIPYVFDEVNINQWAGMIGGYLPNTNLDVITKKAWEFQNSSSYGINSYSKPAMMLRTLENFLGEEIFARIIKTYSLRWRYKHPRPQAFINVVNEITGKDISWFFDQFLNTAYVLDYAVGRVSSKPISEKQGIFDKNGEKVFLKGIKEDTTGKEKIYETDVIIQRKGEIKIPVEIVITFDNGEKEKRVWDGQYRWTRYTFRKPAKWRTVQVDPEHKLVIDINYTNNSRVNDKWRTPAVKWATRWLFWFQHLLETFTFFS